ncbi:MAG: CooT family nickel-binding protein [bacterium]
MKIILKQGDNEEVVLENASMLEVIGKGVKVSALFEQPKIIQGAEVHSIDFLNGRVTVTKRWKEA